MASLLCGSSHVQLSSCHTLIIKKASLMCGSFHAPSKNLILESHLSYFVHLNGFSPVCVLSCPAIERHTNKNVCYCFVVIVATAELLCKQRLRNLWRGCATACLHITSVRQLFQLPQTANFCPTAKVKNVSAFNPDLWLIEIR